MFGTSGIRGAVGEEVTAHLGVKLGTALAAWGADRVVIGRDARPSGEYLKEAVRSGLRQGGTDVIDLGMASTPTVSRSVAWQNASAGIAVTASHNPPPDNGFKLWRPSGQAFTPGEQSEIEALMKDPSTTRQATWDEVGQASRWRGARNRHVEAIVEGIEISEPLNIVVDIGNGVGQVTAKALEELGCSVRTLNGQPDGTFPGRPSEPTPEHCADLQHVVPAVGADLGIAHDGDADRMRAVDAEGTFLTGDALLALFATHTATAGDRIVAPVDTSLAVEDTLAEADIEMVRSPVGDVFVADRIQETGAVFGGEPSGAWIWPEASLCPDGALAACNLAALVAEHGPLSTQTENIRTYPIRRETIQAGDKPGIMQRVTESLRESDHEIETLDGVRVVTEDGWFLIRPSGTEPIIRITAEAREVDRSEQLLAKAMDRVTAASEGGM